MPQPKKQKKPATKRAAGFTRISVTLPDGLLAELDAVAAADNRTRSNLLKHMIRRIISNAPASQGLALNCPKSGGFMGPDDAC